MSNLGSFFTWGLPQGLAVPLMRDRCAELCGFLPGSSHYRPDLPLGRGLGARPWDPRLPARCHVFVSSCLFQFGSAGNSHSTSSLPWSRLLGQVGWVSTWRDGNGGNGSSSAPLASPARLEGGKLRVSGRGLFVNFIFFFCSNTRCEGTHGLRTAGLQLQLEESMKNESATYERGR